MTLEPDIDARLVERVSRCFDRQGRLMRWPSKRSEQVPVLWALWAQLPSGEVHTEQEISGRLKAMHAFGDHALLRRELVELGLVSRTPDCREYRRVEQPVPADAAALIQRLQEVRARA
jgi:hypothetical protein